MSTIAMYECTSLVGSNKVGNLVPIDDSGYYLMVIGALDTPNSAGIPYPYDTTKKFFDEGSVFQRRVKSGVIYAENGHPHMESWMTEEEKVKRIFEIRESRQCAHIRRIYLAKFASDPGVVYIMGEVRPSGELSYVLKDDLANKDANICWSGRYLARTIYTPRGREKKMLDIPTYDKVGEPGIKQAMKWNSPSLESYNNLADIVINDNERLVFTEETVERCLKDKNSAVSVESVDSMTRVLAAMRQPQAHHYPASLKWR